MPALLPKLVYRCVVLAVGMDHFSPSSQTYDPIVFENEWALAIQSLVVAPHDLRRLLV